MLRERVRVDGGQVRITPPGLDARLMKDAAGVVGAADERRIEAGDVIVEVGQEFVAAPEDVFARIQELKGDDRRSVIVMLANKSGELRSVPLRLD